MTIGVYPELHYTDDLIYHDWSVYKLHQISWQHNPLILERIEQGKRRLREISQFF